MTGVQFLLVCKWFVWLELWIALLRVLRVVSGLVVYGGIIEFPLLRMIFSIPRIENLGGGIAAHRPSHLAPRACKALQDKDLRRFSKVRIIPKNEKVDMDHRIVGEASFSCLRIGIRAIDQAKTPQNRPKMAHFGVFEATMAMIREQ